MPNKAPIDRLPEIPRGARARSIRGRSLLNLSQLSNGQFTALVASAQKIKQSCQSYQNRRSRRGGTAADLARGHSGARGGNALPAAGLGGLANTAHNGRGTRYLRGKSIVLYFTAPSTRTRLAFHSAMHAEGGLAISVSPEDLHIGGKESVGDSVLALSQMADALVHRGTDHALLEELSSWATVPVINALTPLYHPTQGIADMLTIAEHHGRLRGIKIAYFGDSDNNVARSLALAACKCDAQLYCASPAGNALDPRTRELCEAIALDHKRLPVVTTDPGEAAAGADVIYTDVWRSLGSKALAPGARKALSPYQVTGATLKAANENAIFMHCLPATRGEEVTAEVIDGPRSRVWQQANNRMHTIRALLRAILA